jgi:membrane protein YqaA with SNARE-associated domain
MDILIAEHAWLALFVLSFLAATLIPLGSEWLLVLLLVDGQSPIPLISLATAGNSLGACTTYAVGLYGGPWLVRKVLRIDDEQQQRAENFYCRYGSWSLLLSWLPVIGDPLCLAGGVLRVGFARFVVLVASGKLVRYAVVGWLTLQAAG